MRVLEAAALAALFLAPPAAKPPPPKPLAPLALLPSVGRVKLTSHGKSIAVVTEVTLPRGDWKGEPLAFHVGFGVPGPRAIDAHLVAVGDGELEARDDDIGEALPLESVSHRPPSAHPLLGRDTFAGVVVRIRPELLTAAFAPGNMAVLRIRSLSDATEPDPSGATSVVVRLGASRGTPLTLGRIVATSAAGPLAKVEAHLCGPDADPHLLAVTPRAPDADRYALIAPVLAVRHVTDDLCVKLWSSK